MSSSDLAISIRGLSKSYTLSHERNKATNLGEAITQRLRDPFKRAKKETFWALKDIDLDIKKGEVVGVIGRNGAGKSTLLKVLSRITEPTTGQIDLYGRVGSLLEVGTGFHPELTGRENIFLNGAILGMRRPEIRRQFDAIVDFAGVEKFLDTPVKRYSSGMYVRLAFAVAAHLNPEILIVDEVLAVGDAEFQKKCLGKMKDVSRSGRTVLLVSHQMMTIESLATSCIHLKAGETAAMGNPVEVISEYIRGPAPRTRFEGLLIDGAEVDKAGGFQFISLELRDGKTGDSIDRVVTGHHVTARVFYKSEQRLKDVTVSLGIKSSTGELLTSFPSEAIKKSFCVEGEGFFDCEVERWPVSAGTVSVSLMARFRGSTLHWVPEAGAILVESGDYYGFGFAPRVTKPIVLSDFGWSIPAGETPARAAK